VAARIERHLSRLPAGPPGTAINLRRSGSGCKCASLNRVAESKLWASPGGACRPREEPIQLIDDLNSYGVATVKIEDLSMHVARQSEVLLGINGIEIVDRVGSLAKDR
jgi:hypothetical protein